MSSRSPAGSFNKQSISCKEGGAELQHTPRRVFQKLLCPPRVLGNQSSCLPCPCQSSLPRHKDLLWMANCFLYPSHLTGTCLWMKPWLLFHKHSSLGSTCSKIFSKVIKKCAHTHTHIQGFCIILIGFSFSALLRNTTRNVEGFISQKSNQQALLKNWHKQIEKREKTQKEKTSFRCFSQSPLCFCSTSFNSEVILILLPPPARQKLHF